MQRQEQRIRASFSLRILAHRPIEELAQQLAIVLGCQFREYRGEFFNKKPAFESTVLGIWVTLVEVQSEEPDAPRRYQLSGAPPERERGPWEETIELHEFILQVLQQAGIEGWYRPSKKEFLIDAGLGGSFSQSGGHP